MPEEYGKKFESNVKQFRPDTIKVKGTIEQMREEFVASRSDMNQGFGSVRASIESLIWWIVAMGLGAILSVWGAALALALFLEP